MKVSEILKKNEVTISCEIFPPKQGAQLQNYKAIAAEIAKLKPAYISCTYGATGGTSDYTVEIADAINSYGVPAIAHLTCVSSTREKVHTVIHELKERGIENILALRGDIPTNTDFPLPDQYHHAIELIREIREAGDFCIGGACYPEGHPEAANMNEDLDHLKEKVDAGCEYLTTQMFFDNNIYYRFLYKALAKGIDVPVDCRNHAGYQCSTGEENDFPDRKSGSCQIFKHCGSVWGQPCSHEAGRNCLCNRADY